MINTCPQRVLGIQGRIYTWGGVRVEEENWIEFSGVTEWQNPPSDAEIHGYIKAKDVARIDEPNFIVEKDPGERVRGMIGMGWQLDRADGVWIWSNYIMFMYENTLMKPIILCN